MTIDKAIKTLAECADHVNPWSLPDLPDAAKLGIEALKRISELRRYPTCQSNLLLPGEKAEE